MPIMGPRHRTQLPERPFKLDCELSRWKGSGPWPAPPDNLEGRAISTTQVTRVQFTVNFTVDSTSVVGTGSLGGEAERPTQDQKDMEGMCVRTGGGDLSNRK